MQNTNITFEFPNEELKNLWPTIYKKIVDRVKEPIVDNPSTPFEESIRSILRDHLDMNLVKTDEKYRIFFKNVLRYSINLHTDKMLYKIESGRKVYRTDGVKRDNTKIKKEKV
jgi:hypothetical protein